MSMLGALLTPSNAFLHVIIPNFIALGLVISSGVSKILGDTWAPTAWDVRSVTPRSMLLYHVIIQNLVACGQTVWTVGRGPKFWGMLGPRPLGWERD